MANLALSVIVPVYNVKPFLAECLDSILSQKGADFELILVDDGSTDGCGEMCDAYAARDARTKVLHKTNGGLSSARNRGMDAASGEFLLFIDSDDYIVPGALETLLRAQRETGADFVRARYRNVFAADVPASYTGGSEFFAPPEKSFASMKEIDGKPVIMFMGSACILLERREILERNRLRFREDILQGEDWYFTVALAEIADREGLRYHFIDEELYCYRRQTHNSITATYSPTKSRRTREALQRIDFLREYLEKTYPASAVAAALGDIYVNHLIRYMVVCAADELAGVSADAYGRFKKVFDSPGLRRMLRYYKPARGRGKSRLIPLLVRLRLSWPAFQLCRRKAAKRYGREIAEMRSQRSFMNG